MIGKAPLVEFEAREGIAILRLNEPERRNPLTRGLKAEMARLVELITVSPEIRAVVLTGAGSTFCAGGDIDDMGERDTHAVRKRLKETQRWAHKILHCAKPTIAAVNGAAAGAGLGLALLCDLAIASDRAKFRASFPTLGAAPDGLVAYTLPRSVGMARAREMLLCNRVVTPEAALAWGMINEVVPHDQLMTRALGQAAELANGPTFAFELAKGLLMQSYGPIEGFMDAEANAQAVAFGSTDFEEGVAAFQAKRPSTFRGR